MKRTTSTKSLRQARGPGHLMKGLYVLDMGGSPLAVIRKAGRAWDSRPFGGSGTWTRHDTLAAAMGSELAAVVNGSAVLA